MNKEEQEIRDEFKQLVIMGNHPECKTYEEALKKELGFGCRVEFVDDFPNIYFGVAGKADEDMIYIKHNYEAVFLNNRSYSSHPINFKIIGQPITISRVIKILPNKFVYCQDKPRFIYIYENSRNYQTGVCLTKWKLTTNTGSEATDDDQNIETIEKLLEVFR